MSSIVAFLGLILFASSALGAPRTGLPKGFVKRGYSCTGSSCGEGYCLNQLKCVKKCPGGTWPDAARECQPCSTIHPMCVACNLSDGLAVCKGCRGDLVVFEGSCVPCGEVYAHCASCDDGACVACDDGFHVEGGACVADAVPPEGEQVPL